MVRWLAERSKSGKDAAKWLVRERFAGIPVLPGRGRGREAAQRDQDASGAHKGGVGCLKALQEEIKVLSEKVGEAKSKGAEAPADAVTEGGEKKEDAPPAEAAEEGEAEEKEEKEEKGDEELDLLCRLETRCNKHHRELCSKV